MALQDCKVGPALATADIGRAREFYEGKLGLEGEDGPGGARVYECGGGTGLFVYPSPEHAGRSTATLAGWEVPDVEALVDELSANGVTFEQYDGEQMKTNEKGIVEFDGMKAAFFRDPDGNTHSINGS